MSKKYYMLEKNEEKRTANLYIFGEIVDAETTGFQNWLGLETGDVSGFSIANELNGLDVDEINVYLNCPGGYYFEGVAIFNLLVNHKAKIITHDDAIAASAAGVIFMAGDERIMYDTSAFMMHKVMNSVSGNSDDLKAEADKLEKFNSMAINAYMRGGADKNTVASLMDGQNHQGTYLSADEALKYGFATKVIKSQAGGEQMSAQGDITKMLLSAQKAQQGGTAVKGIKVSVDLGTTDADAKLDKLEARLKAVNVAVDNGDSLKTNFKSLCAMFAKQKE